MPVLRVNGCDLFYEERGSGTPIVFSHGLLFSTAMFEGQVDRLSDRYRCVSYDHRGQGRSSMPKERTIEVETTYQDAIELIESLGLAPCHFVGLSMGGFVGMRIAARRPELLRSLVLLETSAGPEPPENVGKYRKLNAIARMGGIRFLTSQVMPILFGRTFLEDDSRAEERQRWERHLASLPRRIYRAVNGVIDRDSVEHEVGSIQTPTLIMVGEEDVATTPDKSEVLHRAIEGSKLVRIPRAGHSSSIESPQRVSDEIAQFLEEVPA